MDKYKGWLEMKNMGNENKIKERKKERKKRVEELQRKSENTNETKEEWIKN